MSAEPVALLNSLALAKLPYSMHLMLGVPFSTAAAALPANCAITTFGGMGSAGRLSQSRALQFSPIAYGRSASMYAQGLWSCDVALVSLARNADGSLHLGASHGPILAAARRARHVIAEINVHAPCVPGAPWPADLPISAVIESRLPLAPVRTSEPTQVEQDIARHVATLVPDGACLQVGIGALPSAALTALGGHRHLGVHSGTMTDSLQALVDSGAVDHSRKTVDTGFAVVGSIVGSDRLYRTADQNPRMRLREPGYTHDAAVIASIDDFFSLNSAIEVDLLGNTNAECTVGADGRWRHVGGVGGLPDFMRAARLSRNGKAVIALPSRASHARPRIVARLSGPCTVAASDADCIATEYGVARLRDASYDQRVRQMLAIAHPEDREMLTAQAQAWGLL
ncbi:MAG: acetyl-CoA hydrolase/transferase C-terminal domain-containing protein [Burkholderiaceae bacterium]